MKYLVMVLLGIIVVQNTNITEFEAITAEIVQAKIVGAEYVKAKTMFVETITLAKDGDDDSILLKHNMIVFMTNDEIKYLLTHSGGLLNLGDGHGNVLAQWNGQ